MKGFLARITWQSQVHSARGLWKSRWESAPSEAVGLSRLSGSLPFVTPWTSPPSFHDPLSTLKLVTFVILNNILKTVSVNFFPFLPCTEKTSNSCLLRFLLTCAVCAKAGDISVLSCGRG